MFFRPKLCVGVVFIVNGTRRRSLKGYWHQ